MTPLKNIYLYIYMPTTQQVQKTIIYPSCFLVEIWKVLSIHGFKNGSEEWSVPSVIGCYVQSWEEVLTLQREN